MTHSFCSYQIHLVKQFPSVNYDMILMGNVSYCGPDHAGTQVYGNFAIDFNGNRKAHIVGICKYQIFVPIIYKLWHCLQD